MNMQATCEYTECPAEEHALAAELEQEIRDQRVALLQDLRMRAMAGFRTDPLPRHLFSPEEIEAVQQELKECNFHWLLSRYIGLCGLVL